MNLSLNKTMQVYMMLKWYKLDFFTKEETPSKLDDVWPIERVWAIMTKMVYSETNENY